MSALEQFKDHVNRLFVKPDDTLGKILHASVGIAGEAGEILDTVKKAWIYHANLDNQNLLEEVGDSLFYLQALAIHCGFTLEQAMQANIAKLKKRYPDGYTDKAARERADKRQPDDDWEVIENPPPDMVLQEGDEKWDSFDTEWIEVDFGIGKTIGEYCKDPTRLRIRRRRRTDLSTDFECLPEVEETLKPGDWVVCLRPEYTELRKGECYEVQAVDGSFLKIDGEEYLSYRFRRARPDEIPNPPPATSNYSVPADGWIPWSGGECPLDGETPVECRVRNGGITSTKPAAYFRWSYQMFAGDIVAYRLVQPTPQNSAKVNLYLTLQDGEKINLAQIGPGFAILPTYHNHIITAGTRGMLHVSIDGKCEPVEVELTTDVDFSTERFEYTRVEKQYRPFASAEERIEALEKSLRECVHVLEKGIAVRMVDKWPALHRIVPEAIATAKNVLARPCGVEVK